MDDLDLDLAFASPKTSPTFALDSKPPDKARALRAWALGPELMEWSEQFTPTILEKSDVAINQIGRAMDRIDSQMDMLEGSDDDASRAEEMRLTILREKNVAMLARMVKIHGTLTAGGVAAMFASLHAPRTTTNNIVNVTGHDPTVPFPRRTLGSAEDQIVEV